MAIATGTALAVGGGLAAAGSVAGGVIGANTTKKAGEQQASAADKSIDFQKQQFEQSRQDLEPFRQSQLLALQQQQQLTDPNSQVYEQQRGINTQAIQRQLASQGLLRSKSQVDLLSNLELGLNQQRLGVIGGIAGNGATEGIVGLRNNLSQNVGSAFQNFGQNQAQTTLAGAQNTLGVLQGVNNSFQGGLGGLIQLNNQKTQNQQYQDWLSRAYPKG